MKTVIEMAKEAGDDWDSTLSTDKQFLERFAELIRADQDEKYKWDVHSCGPTCTNAVCVAIREAVEAEREACAKVCEQDDSMRWSGAANAIRSRRNT